MNLDALFHLNDRVAEPIRSKPDWYRAYADKAVCNHHQTYSSTPRAGLPVASARVFTYRAT